MVEQLRGALHAADGDRVVWLSLEDLGERGLRLLDLALLDVGAAEAIVRVDVVGRGLEDLLVQVGGARPVRVEGGRHRLICEGADAQACVG